MYVYVCVYIFVVVVVVYGPVLIYCFVKCEFFLLNNIVNLFYIIINRLMKI